MASTITFGMSKIELGELTAAGGVATNFETLGYSQEDSVTITTDDPEEIALNVEESDDPIFVKKKGGKTTIAFNVADPDLNVFEEMMGGTVASGTWSSPATLPTIERSVKLTPEQGLETTYTRVSLSAKWQPAAGKKGFGLLQISGSVLTPTLANEPKVRVKMVTSGE